MEQPVQYRDSVAYTLTHSYELLMRINMYVNQKQWACLYRITRAFLDNKLT